MVQGWAASSRRALQRTHSFEVLATMNMPDASSTIGRADFAGPVRIHYRRAGSAGKLPLVFLHGWPEFSRVWEPVMERLAATGRFDLIAPDYRGFGDSENPDGERQNPDVGASVHAADVAALIEGLGFGKVGLVGHDIGGMVIQALARLQPDRFPGLFLFDCPNPSVGPRSVAPGHLTEIWYQSFHLLPWAAGMVGSSREACRIYFRHFLSHWSAHPQAFDEAALEEWVDNFLKPGNLQGGFNFYLSNHKQRVLAAEGKLPPLPPITVPACVRWGARDPVLPVAWADSLEKVFTDLDFKPLPGLGHFPHWEDPDRAASEIVAFFGRFA